VYKRSGALPRAFFISRHVMASALKDAFFKIDASLTLYEAHDQLTCAIKR